MSTFFWCDGTSRVRILGATDDGEFNFVRSMKASASAGRAALWMLGATAGLLGGCTTNRPAVEQPAALASYVVLTEDGQALARVLTAAPQCPVVRIDGVAQIMGTRVAPATALARPGQAKAAVFSARVCETPVPAAARSVQLADTPLPLPRGEYRRIVVLGDTGCRIKASARAFQACDDPEQWPFAAIADAAAREGPDLVVHVGDYHYRESPCPLGQPCADSVWGYGWDAWNADLFSPGKSLLLAAPWVVVRGNHEECARAGQGWFRLLDPRPYAAQRSCDEPRNDGEADFSEPYAVPLGDHWQLIVFDSAAASKPLDQRRASDVRLLAHYRQNMRVVDQLAAAPGMHSLFVSHHPVLGFAVEPSAVRFGNEALLAAMKSLNGTRYFPAGVEAGVHGHVHAFQAIDFSSAHPAALVAGHGGDKLDATLTATIAASYPSVEDVRIGAVAHSESFGYLMLERDAAGWTIRARRPDGSTLTTCALRAGHLTCDANVPTSRPLAAAAQAVR